MSEKPNDGTMYGVHVDQMGVLDAEFEKRVQYAVKSKTHLWISTVAFYVSDAALDTLSTEPILMDRENIALYPGVGCYVCECVYTRRERHRTCPGEPHPHVGRLGR